MFNQILSGDCLQILPTLPKQSIDCVVTSPPYAMQRNQSYSSISEENYPAWSVSWMNALRDCLKPHGSVAIVIRPHLMNGQISDYVLKTRLALRAENWVECDELIWIKPQSPPLGSKKRPRRSWESILWFAQTGDCYCEPKNNGKLSTRVGFCGKKHLGQKFKVGSSEPITKIARCQDYVEVGTSKNDRSAENTHPAQYPVDLAAWLIKLLSPEDGVVLDPFMGSGSTAIAAIREKRKYVGIEQNADYIAIAQNRLKEHI